MPIVKRHLGFVDSALGSGDSGREVINQNFD